MCFLIALLILISIRTGELRRQVFFKKSYQYYEVFSNIFIYMGSSVDVCARTEDPWARVGVPAAHRARSSNNRHQDPESSLNLKKWKYIHLWVYGSVSAGREKWPFNVIFF